MLRTNWIYNLHESRLRVFNEYGSYIQRILQTKCWGKSIWLVDYSNTEHLSDKLAANKLIQSDNLHIWFPHRTDLRTDISSWLQRVTKGSEEGWIATQAGVNLKGVTIPGDARSVSLLWRGGWKGIQSELRASNPGYLASFVCCWSCCPFTACIQRRNAAYVSGQRKFASDKLILVKSGSQWPMKREVRSSPSVCH